MLPISKVGLKVDSLGSCSEIVRLAGKNSTSLSLSIRPANNPVSMMFAFEFPRESPAFLSPTPHNLSCKFWLRNI
ncbi:hypothetical protein AYI69_g8322 [Smittium culicis]|uniref:Uncharacterized protein n=1 Tax=Smittium culicis TaxID=133412 RepID=A0A1R1XKC5_9FUNG|nr:hypothetical protein AYI69_g8322 [Smittium culicis]